MTIRADFLGAARRIALGLGREGKPVTVKDVRQYIAPPDNIDPRVMGVVFRTKDWICLGYTLSRRRISHGRPIAMFVRRDAA